MKIPEQLAEEYAEFETQGVPDSIRKQLLMTKDKMAFLAGYKAAKDQLADADKAMNSPEKQDSCEHILDMEKMVDVNSSSGWINVKDRLPEDWECCLWFASSHGEFDCGWENNECINLRCKTGCGQKFDVGAIFICEFHRKDKHHEQHYLIDDANNVALIDCFTHWMPLPEAPKGEG